MKNTAQNSDIDGILKYLGDFGKFQIINYILISFPVLLSGAFTLSYVFTAGQLEYRCKIPQCDSELAEFRNDWLPYAIPHIPDGNPIKCRKFRYLTENLNDTGDICTAKHFDTSIELRCDEFIYETNELTIVNEFNITCDENEWKLSMVGSANSAAQFIFMPLAGYLSDKFGRRTVLIFSLLASGIFGIFRSFANSYEMFLLMEFAEAGLGVGTYSAALILGMELVQSKRRVFTGSLVALCNSFGGAILGLLAMYTQNFRILLRLIYAPAFLALFYFCMIPESLRWLMIHGKGEQVTNIIQKAARKNRVIIPAETMRLVDQTENLIEVIKSDDQSSNIPGDGTTSIFKSMPLLIRVALCSFCWMTNTFVFYGLSLNAVSFDGDKYLNFIAVILAEIPSIMVTYFLIDRLGRRWSFCGSMLVCGFTCIGSALLPHQMSIFGLFLYILGKCAITISFTILYVYTAELFPTRLRHTLLSFCSMVGRIGTIVAPQTPLLARYMQSLPLIMFGSSALIAGVLSLNFPETLNTKLPDTIEEAETLNGQIKRCPTLVEILPTRRS